MFRRLYDAAVRCGADIAASGHCEIANGKLLASKPHPLAGRTLTDRQEIMEVRKNLYGHRLYDPRIESFPMAVWIALYRKDLIDSHGLSFESVLSEDIIFNLDVYRHAGVITFTADADYCYRKENQSSITNNFSEATIVKYQKFFRLLAEKAAAEEDPECVIRAKRTAIDYCRPYVTLVGKAGVPFQKKKQLVKQFAENPEICCRWEGHPLKALPLQQCVFHAAIVRGYYGAALVMCSLRQMLKSRGKTLPSDT